MSIWRNQSLTYPTFVYGGGPYPCGICTKGGPHQFEAIFFGYEENHIGWHVHGLSGKYHFPHDLIFNESLPGHLGRSRSFLPDIPVDTDTHISHLK